MHVRSKKAEELFLRGFNCSQSVAAAFDDEAGLSQKDLLRMGSGFGGGVADTKETCGAVSGMLMAAGLTSGFHEPVSREEKDEYNRRMRSLMDEFAIRFGSVFCRELLENRDKSVPKREYCVRLVRGAAEILAGFIPLMESENP